ncbi:MAG: cystathionine gamma-synthase family protein [Verrucomicrobia bacterium]|jgi:methionine-gamma-lyase|nr:cystathionine gamma-synthase family protein [Verrucomicrobiota bacterium]MBT7064900.1 cystathionine gamma-synthase family protein [Verrucomicrobiota bacterium]MBT7699973.1 cystathionine gamma-synthase family protein [Verrucomicrobiota bacterium]
MKHKPYKNRMLGDRELHPSTLMMGYGYDPTLSEGALKPPIFMTSTFVFDNAQHGKEFFELAYGKREASPGEELGLIYSRINNPDLEFLEDRLALWEDAEKGLAFSSGMSAIATTLLAYLRPGDVVVHSAPIYGGSEYLIRNILPAFGIDSVEFESGFKRLTLAPAVEEALPKGRVAVIYAETPANPTNGLVDLHECARLADDIASRQGGHRPIVVIDNTFLGPVWQQALQHGADVSVYSLTKYVGGHSDLVAGAVLGSRERLAPIMGFRTILGTMCSPHTGWLIMRSLETLQVRMEKSAANARTIADYLNQHPKVTKVHYLDFIESGTLAREIYERQCTSPGSTFSFDIAGGEAEAFQVLDHLQIIKLAVSLGGTESLMEHPFTMTHSDVPDDVKHRLGVNESLLRISVGIEDAGDLIADLDQALASISGESND